MGVEGVSLPNNKGLNASYHLIFVRPSKFSFYVKLDFSLIHPEFYQIFVRSVGRMGLSPPNSAQAKRCSPAEVAKIMMQLLGVELPTSCSMYKEVSN